MMYKYLLLCLVALTESISAFQISSINRRGMLRLVPTLPLLTLPVMCKAEEENRPLTPEEMEEYNRLLEEAKRIQSIIDSNIKAADEEFAKRLKEIQKNK
jgi:hypothetical protein